MTLLLVYQSLLRYHGYGASASHGGVSVYACSTFRWYQVILLGDRGKWVWTTCPRLLLDSAAVQSIMTSASPQLCQTLFPLTLEHCANPNAMPSNPDRKEFVKEILGHRRTETGLEPKT